MTVSFFLCQLGAFCVYFLLSSFTEWTFHRYAFHTPKVSRYMFNAHTLVHHQIYKGDETYRTEEEHPHHVPMNWWALPAMLGAHLPLLLLVQWLTGIPSVWGGLLAVSTYYGIYESIHWAMHVPRAAKFLNQFHVFRYLDAHHHVHHKYMLSNLNVVLPLADLTLGTLRATNGKRIRLFHRTPKPAAQPMPRTRLQKNSPQL